jgi:CBS domain-containing protein
MRIREVLAGKAVQGVVTITPDTSVRDLVARLAEHNIGAVVVSTDGVTVEGIVSERDVVRRLGRDDAVLDATVGAIMTSEVQTARPDQTINELMVVMTEGRFRHLPVVHEGRLTGVVSIGDVVKHRMKELEFERDQLDSYVHSSQT